jgi:UDPglucose 6-dehydrogenase
VGIGIAGYGWVGKAQKELFPSAYVYDEPQIEQSLPPAQSENAIRIGRAALNNCEVAFICVPTPNRPDGSLDSSIVEEVAGWCESDVICIRSTLNPGDADKIKEQTGKHIVTQPEYLGETTAHPMLNPKERPFVILGGEPQDRRKVIEAYQGAYNANISIRQVSNLEAEVIKLTENRAIAHKVAQCQELYDVCEAAGVDYYTVRDAVYGDDPRFNLWFSFVYPERRGMESKCIPKDVLAWAAWAESAGIEPTITKAILAKNEEWTGKANNPNRLEEAA